MKTHIGIKIVSIAVLILVLTATITLGGSLPAFIDLPSFGFILFVLLTSLMFSGQLADYARGIGISMGKTEYTMKELKASAIAIDLAIRVTFLSGILGTIVGNIQILRLLDSGIHVGSAISVSLLTLFYSLFINVIQYSVKALVSKEIIYRQA